MSTISTNIRLMAKCNGVRNTAKRIARTGTKRFFPFPTTIDPRAYKKLMAKICSAKYWAVKYGSAAGTAETILSDRIPATQSTVKTKEAHPLIPTGLRKSSRIPRDRAFSMRTTQSRRLTLCIAHLKARGAREKSLTPRVAALVWRSLPWPRLRSCRSRRPARAGGCEARCR